MEKFSKLIRAGRSGPLGCLVCGVDSAPIRYFLIFFMGSLVLSSLSVLLWAVVTRRFQEVDKLSRLPLEREEGEKYGA